MFLSILSCNYGGGHRRVGEAIAEEWKARTGGRVDIADYFARFVHPVFDAVTKFSYIQSVRRAPVMYGMFYRATGEIKPDSVVQRAINRMGLERLDHYLQTERPDVVCCVHCTPAGTMSDLKIAGRTTVPCATVITDYVTHSQWIHPCVDRYCVPAASVRDGLISRGIPAERITDTGLPIERKFLRPLNREVLLERFGLVPGRPVVLVMAGAYAMLGGVGDVVRVLARFPRPLQALVVCGHDRRMTEQVRARTANAPHPFRTFEYVDNVEELMAVSDLLITKAGAVTVTEALVRQLPMLIYRPIPGQEEGNTEYLLEHGAALAPKTPEMLREMLEMLLADPARLEAMRRATASLARPEATEQVVARLAALATTVDAERTFQRTLATSNPRI
ncbi:MAG TPA: glycosyltransferase [bacterium]|nr:glycosyltransferase [bacterium]